MYTVKFKLQEIANKVNYLLELYVDIHNRLFISDIRRIISLRFIDKAIDFPMLLKQTVAVKDQLEVAMFDLQYISIAENDTCLPQIECQYLHVMSEYVGALLKAMNGLQIILMRLCDKIDDSSPYRYREYREQIKYYELSIEKYVSLGNAMNAYYHAL